MPPLLGWNQKSPSQQQQPLRCTTWQAQQENFSRPSPHGPGLCAVQNLICHYWWLCPQHNLDKLEQLENFSLEPSDWKCQEKGPQKIPNWSHPVFLHPLDYGRKLHHLTGWETFATVVPDSWDALLSIPCYISYWRCWAVAECSQNWTLGCSRLLQKSSFLDCPILPVLYPHSL